MIDVDNKLFNLREDNDLYQRDIAKIVGVNQQTYSSWELGKKVIPLKHLHLICNYFNVSMDYVLNLSDYKLNNKEIKVIELNKNEIGKRIKYIRTNNNLTLRQLAKDLNTTSSTISAYETGKTFILTSFAYQICKKYHISLDWLCGRSKNMYLNTKINDLQKIN